MIKRLFSFLLLLLLFCSTACSSVKSSESTKKDYLEIDGTFYIDRNYYSSEDLSKGIYHNSELVFAGSFELPAEIQKNNEISVKPRLYFLSIQNENFQRPISFSCDYAKNKYSFETRLNKNSLKDLGIKLMGDSLLIKGWYELPGDTSKRSINFSFFWDVVFNNEFISLVSGEIEEELGVRIDREHITSLQLNLNHPDIEKYLHILPELTGIRNLEIQGTRGHEIPKELFKLNHLDSVNISELYDIDIDHQPDNSVISSPIIFPMQFLSNSNLRSMRIAGARIEIKDMFPESTNLKALYFKAYQLDSLPISFLNLKNLEIIDFTNGQIEHSIPENFNQVKDLRVMKICLPKAIVPKGFGPWPNLEQLFIYPAIDPIKNKALFINDSDLDYLLKVVNADTNYINGKYF